MCLHTASQHIREEAQVSVQIRWFQAVQTYFLLSLHNLAIRQPFFGEDATDVKHL